MSESLDVDLAVVVHRLWNSIFHLIDPLFLLSEESAWGSRKLHIPLKTVILQIFERCRHNLIKTDSRNTVWAT